MQENTGPFYSHPESPGHLSWVDDLATDIQGTEIVIILWAAGALLDSELYTMLPISSAEYPASSYIRMFGTHADIRV